MSQISKELRKKYPTFIYKSYNYYWEKNELKINFKYFVDKSIQFNPLINIKGVTESQFNYIDKEVLDNLVFNLGIIEMLSYWKATSSPNIKVECGFLNKKQIIWWTKLLKDGMGEFFYVNNIDSRNEKFVTFSSAGKKHNKKADINSEGILLPVSGGIDSTVTADLLSKAFSDKISTFMLNPSTATKNIAKVLGLTRNVEVQRKIDKNLLDLNNNGFLNGHTPFSAYLAFLSVLCAYIFDLKYILFSNEASSNEGNVEFLGKKINHQYSKSFEFETEFRRYTKTYLSNEIEYFSFLRSLNSIQISKLFSELSVYHNIVLSCNIGVKENRWCGKCAKCLSTYVLLFPFIDQKKIKKMYSKDLLKDKNLGELLNSLTKVNTIKPFECVGTKKEIKFALKLIADKYNKTKEPLPKLIEKALSGVESSDSQSLVMSFYNKNNYLPDKFKSILRESYNA